MDYSRLHDDKYRLRELIKACHVLKFEPATILASAMHEFSHSLKAEIILTEISRQGLNALPELDKNSTVREAVAIETS